jgi:hypothetical protein
MDHGRDDRDRRRAASHVFEVKTGTAVQRGTTVNGTRAPARTAAVRTRLYPLYLVVPVVPDIVSPRD